MTTDINTTMRELDSRFSDGIHVRLLWCAQDQRLLVAVMDTKIGDAFSLEIGEDEHANDVFHHPYAYAACHGVATSLAPRAADASESLAVAEAA